MKEVETAVQGRKALSFIKDKEEMEDLALPEVVHLSNVVEKVHDNVSQLKAEVMTIESVKNRKAYGGLTGGARDWYAQVGFTT